MTQYFNVSFNIPNGFAFMNSDSYKNSTRIMKTQLTSKYTGKGTAVFKAKSDDLNDRKPFYCSSFKEQQNHKIT